MLDYFLEGLDKGNGREIGGSREYGSYIDMKCKFCRGGVEDGFCNDYLTNDAGYAFGKARTQNP